MPHKYLKKPYTEITNYNVNHPKHYTQFPIEVIDMMIKIWGKEKVADYCVINAFKYRMRAGIKDTSVLDDLGKEKWYLNKAKELTQELKLPWE